MNRIDLRSDTVTRPGPGMRAAMAEAEVGDDVYGEDPSVNRLQEEAARLLGKEAALFVPSGTMANQAALASLGSAGDVVLAGRDAHILVYESGAPWALFGLGVQTIGEDGSFDGSDVRAALSPSEGHFAPTRILAAENTHNRAGGSVFPLEKLRDASSVAREAGLALHLDGARLFNAVAATGVPASTWADPFDTVSFCLSKGLGAPVGSLVCASREGIQRVHRMRKRLGGGMRQAGILAAAGLYALEHHLERLNDDHLHAQQLAAGLEALGLRVEPKPQTNMVFFEISDAPAFRHACAERDLLVNPVTATRFRAVTHLDVAGSDIEDALGRIAEVLALGIR